MSVLSLSYLLSKKSGGLQATGEIFPSIYCQPTNLGSSMCHVIRFKNLKKGSHSSRRKSLQQLFLCQLTILTSRLFQRRLIGLIPLSFKAYLKTLKIL